MIDDKEIEQLLEGRTNNIICKKFCLLPSNIALYIDSMAKCKEEYGYVLIGVDNTMSGYAVCGINTSINFFGIYCTAIKQSGLKPETEQQLCNVYNKNIWVIKVKTCKLQQAKIQENIASMENVIRDLYLACIKLQGNSVFYTATEDQRNDYIRDLLETNGYQVKDQTRRGLSPTGKAAGEVDIFVHDSGFPITIIEALNLKSLDTTYLDKHVDKIYNYDTTGNNFNVILSYVSVINFEDFWINYCEHVKEHTYPYQITGLDETYSISNGQDYSDINMLVTKHRRNGKETLLYHVCVKIG